MNTWLLRVGQATGVAVCAATAGGVLAAVGWAGYGPALPPSGVVPGGFDQVLATTTVDPRGGTVIASVGAVTAKVVVPHLYVPLQMTMTMPGLAQLRAALPVDSRWRGRVLSGMALNARMSNGVMVRGRFGGTITLALHDARFQPGDRVLHWNARVGRFVPFPKARITVRHGLILLHVKRGQEIVVLGKQARRV